MAEPRTWDDFDVYYLPTDSINRATEGHPSGEDGIDQARELGVVDPEYIELGLSTANDITWWKSIRAYSAGGHDIGQIAMQDDDHGPRWFRLPLDQLRGGRLDIEKAKLFGVHTAMYTLRFDDMPDGGGTRFTFGWHYDAS
ncbi:MAG: hypothetical protein M3401_13685 [Actinomycetota bacterium]|nr:hypothetical protein [Actinomycetota bacterium]